MKTKFFFFIIFFSYSLTVNSADLRVIDMQMLIENCKSFKEFYLQINNDQKKFSNIFKAQENDLEEKLEELNQLKLILNNEELEKEIDKYNKSLNNFNIKVKKFNSHYDNQINNLRNNIINKILELLQEYSLENQIDLILDANDYILSSNSINISNLILVKLNNIEIEFSFEKYK